MLSNIGVSFMGMWDTNKIKLLIEQEHHIYKLDSLKGHI